jgi:hypothetical protein
MFKKGADKREVPTMAKNLVQTMEAAKQAAEMAYQFNPTSYTCDAMRAIAAADWKLKTILSNAAMKRTADKYQGVQPMERKSGVTNVTPQDEMVRKSGVRNRTPQDDTRPPWE